MFVSSHQYTTASQILDLLEVAHEPYEDNKALVEDPDGSVLIAELLMSHDLKDDDHSVFGWEWCGFSDRDSLGQVETRRGSQSFPVQVGNSGVEINLECSF